MRNELPTFEEIVSGLGFISFWPEPSDIQTDTEDE